MVSNPTKPLTIYYLDILRQIANDKIVKADVQDMMEFFVN